MEWIARSISDAVEKAMKSFPAILITGPRQVGKSTLLRHIAKDYNYITFDNPLLLQQAKEDHELFLLNNSGLLILDEIQYVPELFPYLKIRIDEMRFAVLQGRQSSQCLYLLSGLQTYHLMQNVSESLAGRLVVLPLQGISFREAMEVKCVQPFIPNEIYLEERGKEIHHIDQIWPLIHRGSMPKLVSTQDDWDMFYASYVATYLERDVNQLTKIGDRTEFMRFMTAVAARSAELLNYESVARDLAVSTQTVKRWLAILEASGIIQLVYPYFNNHLKRMIKTPKLYFLDTGLMAWLTRWNSPDALANGAKSGQFFETWVVSEIIKSFLNAGKTTQNLYYYRDADQKEIDLIIEYDNTIYPVEIKMSAKPHKSMARNFSLLNKVELNGSTTVGDGAIINLNPELIMLDEKLRAIPAGFL